MMPSPVDLKYFSAVAETRNFSRAAERLGISQPSLSLAIQRVEHTMGVSLFIRSKRGAVLTQAGQQLLAHTKWMMEQWEMVKHKATASHVTVSGRYAIGCHVSVALYSLPIFLPVLLEKYPQLEVRLLHDLSRKITEAVISHEADVGIVVNPVKHPDLIIKKLCDDEVTFWVGRGNRNIQNPFSGQAVLICDPEMIQARDLIKKMNNHRILYKRILVSSNLEVITSLVTQGAGMGIIPGRVAQNAIAQGLKKVKGAPVFQDEICVIYRVENKGVKAIQSIVESIASII